MARHAGPTAEGEGRMTPADPKPVARVRADLKDWETMREMLAQPCQVCGDCFRTAWVAKSLHHIVPRSQGGDDVPENLAVLCGHGTVGCHGDVEARRSGARTELRLNMTLAQKEYVWARKGEAWMDRHYPLSEGTV